MRRFPLTNPADKIFEGDQVVLVLVQQGEGPVGQRVVVLVRTGGPRGQQPVQAFELGSVQPILPLHKSASGVAVLPRRCFCRCCRAAVAPVQADEMLGLEEEIAGDEQERCGKRRTVTEKRGEWTP